MILEEDLFQEFCIGWTDEKLEAEKVESYSLIQAEKGNKVNPVKVVETKEKWDI